MPVTDPSVDTGPRRSLYRRCEDSPATKVRIALADIKECTILRSWQSFFLVRLTILRMQATCIQVKVWRSISTRSQLYRVSLRLCTCTTAVLDDPSSIALCTFEQEKLIHELLVKAAASSPRTKQVAVQEATQT